MGWPRLSYANVTATVALFVSLGGASYAAVSLPPGSVGPTQLRPGAVTLPKLAFPLAMAAGSSPGPVGVGTHAPDCGTGPAICSPPPPLPTVLTTATLTLSKPSKVLLLGSATIYQLGPPGGTPDRLSLGLDVAGGTTNLQSANVSAESSASVSFQQVVAAAAGRHRYGLTITGWISRATKAQRAQLVAITLPSG